MYNVHPSVLFTDLEDNTAILLHLDTKFYYTLNFLGVKIWQCLMEAPTIPYEIAQKLFDEHLDVSFHRLMDDIEKMFDDMQKEGLITKVEAA